MCLGWAWGAAAMASALRARSQVVLSSAYTRAQSQLVSGVAPDSQFQKFVFEGVFLDARSSAVFGAFFFVGIFALAGLKAVAPKLTFLSIFGMIVMVSSQSSEFSGVVRRLLRCRCWIRDRRRRRRTSSIGESGLCMLTPFPHLFLVQIVFCSYGPLFPSAQYTIATQFLIPTGQSSVSFPYCRRHRNHISCGS